MTATIPKAGALYFGTSELMQWIASPERDADMTMEGWQATGTYLNGGGWGRKSTHGHSTFTFAWTNKTSEQLDVINQYASGVHGDGLIYFLDPFAAEHNLFPSYWAAPRLGASGGPNLAGSGEDAPTLTASVSNTQGYPGQSAVYTLDGSETPATLWIPVPDGYTIHIGAHGAQTGTAYVTVTPDGSSAANLTMLGNDTTTRTNYTHSATSADGVTIAFDGTGTLTLAGLIAQIRPTGTSVPAGGFLAGLGNSGCIMSHPRRTGSNAALDQASLVARLREVGAWAQ